MKITLKNRFLSKITTKAIFISALFVTIAGCESIPPGTPPQGPIVSINTTDKTPLSVKDAINFMTTAIATNSLLYKYDKTPTVTLRIAKIPEELKDIDPKLNYLTSRLFRDLAEMDMVTPPIEFSGSKINFIINSIFTRSYDNIDAEGNLISKQNIVVNWKVELLEPGKDSPLWQHKLKVKIENKNTEDKSKITLNDTE